MGDINISLKLDVVSLQNAIRKLDKLPDDVQRKIVPKAASDAMKPVMDDAKAHVPIDTGWLKKAIGIKRKEYRAKETVVVLVGIKTDVKQPGIVPWRYAHLVEFGTRRTQAKPFLRPALDKNKQNVVDGFSINVAIAIELAANK